MSGASASAGRGRAVVATGATAVAVLLAAIVWSTRSSSARPAPATASAAPASAAAPGAAAPPVVDGGVAGAALAVPASGGGGAAAGAAVQGWSAVAVAARLSDLGPLARPVYDGLQRARAAMDPCFQADERDQAAHPRAPDQDAWGAAILTLQLEARAGELVVVNAPLQELGTSSPSLVECCENLLRGFRIPAPAAIPGKRYRLQHQLTP